jgi:hypothetical protein
MYLRNVVETLCLSHAWLESQWTDGWHLWVCGWTSSETVDLHPSAPRTYVGSVDASAFPFLKHYHSGAPAAGSICGAPMSWTFLFQVASANSKTKYNIKKKSCLGGECLKGVAKALGDGV